MIEKYDLHSHSNASDGILSPRELVIRAKKQGVTCLSLTDHDTTDGLHAAQLVAQEQGIRLIPGIELSVTWQNKTLHIIGLNINPDHRALSNGVKNLQILRLERAEKIATKLAKKNINGAFEAVKQSAGTGMITRTHFADFLLKKQLVNSQQEAFDKFLGKGRPAFVATEWTDLNTAITWILQTGGLPVIAHPLRYKLSASWMRRLLTVFKDSGGAAIEVVTGRSNQDEIAIAGKYAKDFQLSGSVGSDFHSPKNVWVELGRLANLPADIKPVWNFLH